MGATVTFQLNRSHSSLALWGMKKQIVLKAAKIPNHKETTLQNRIKVFKNLSVKTLTEQGFPLQRKRSDTQLDKCKQL